MAAVDLERFVVAQDAGDTYAQAVAELTRGAKRSHWMWFVFPQLAGLGRSSTAQYYALDSLADAQAYLAHPVLRRRLLECAHVLLELRDTTADQVLGSVDALKLRSSMTLFAAAAGDEPVFGQVLARYFDGRPDPATLALL